ncbi:MAG: hypothetical protein H6Q11_1152, partial [Acidobacteria bacterium]|nr:hypothetical protein [Acidobacteriota bacterium]
MERAGRDSAAMRATAVWGAVLLLVFLGLPLLSMTPASGRTALPAADGADEPGPRITGGVEVNPPGRYPFMVALVERGGDAFWD